MGRSDWREQAKCKDLPPDQADKLFFPGAGGKSNSAKKFCSDCPVRLECTDSATLGKEEFGYWGGIAADDLRLMGPDRLEKVQKRHPEKLASYLAFLPPQNRLRAVRDNNFDDDFDDLESPLDFPSLSDAYRQHTSDATFPEAI